MSAPTAVITAPYPLEQPTYFAFVTENDKREPVEIHKVLKSPVACALYVHEWRIANKGAFPYKLHEFVPVRLVERPICDDREIVV